MPAVFEPNVEEAIIKAASAFVFDYLNQPEGTEYNEKDHAAYEAARELLRSKFSALHSQNPRYVFT